jgi:hypothetical protein
MAFLFQSTPKIIPEFTGLQVNTSVQVLPIPIIWGAPRCSVNLIYYNGFNVQKKPTSSGKGILTGGKTSQQVEYFATLILAIGEGVLDTPYIIFQDAGAYIPSNYPGSISWFTGTDTQMPWSVVVAKWPADARPYKDTAYIAVDNGQIDSSATIPQVNIVPRGLLSHTSPLQNTTINITTGQYDANGKPISYIGPIQLQDVDADPAAVIYDFLTNSRYGAGFPSALIDGAALFTSSAGFTPTGDAALSTYCQAVGLAWSVILNNVEPGNSVLERWTKNMTVAGVWNGALLRFIPYWDSPVSANPGYDSGNPLAIGVKYFVPSVPTVVTLTLDHILESDKPDEPPIKFSRKNPWDVYNHVRMNFRDRMNFFNDNSAEVQNEPLVEAYGPRVDTIGQADEYSLFAYANVAVQITLARFTSIRRTFTFKLSPVWGFLDPMDVVSIPDPTDWTKSVLVRIQSITDDTEENSTVEAEEFRPGLISPASVAILNPIATAPPNQGAINAPVFSAARPVMFEPTSAMLTATGRAVPAGIIGTTGLVGGVFDPNWGGVKVWVSLDDLSYQYAGTLVGPSQYGSLSAPLPPAGSTLSVDLRLSNATLGSYSAAAASMGASLCVVQDASGWELVAYTTATLTGPNQFNLTGLYRGMYGTTARLFALGSQFLFVGKGANVFEDALPPQYVGTTIWVKLQSFNVFLGYEQPLSDCLPWEYVPGGTTPPARLPPMIRADVGRRRGGGEVPVLRRRGV